MGAIQNSINNMLTTAAAGIAVAKKVDSKEEPKEEKEVKTSEVNPEKEALKQADTMLKKADAEEALSKLQDAYKVSNAELKQWKKGMVDVGNGTYMQTNDDLSSDIKMRKKALKVMKEKITARKLQVETYAKLIGGKK